MIPGSVQAVISIKMVVKMRLTKKMMGNAGVTVHTVGRTKMQKGITMPIMHA